MNSLQIPNRIAMPCPFGGFGTDNITEIATVSGNDVNFLEGFPSSYAAPSSNDGRFVTRKEMNAIGNLASRDLFYHKCGGLNTFDPKFCAAIGGYPKGAVLQYAVANQIFEVMSLVENNMIDFTSSGSGVGGIIDGSVDGINWVYCNKEIPSVGKVTISSGSTPLGNSASTLDVVEISASGYIVGNIGLEYGDPALGQPPDYNCISTNAVNVFIGGGIFAKKVSGDTSLSVSNINTWTCIAQASQTGGLTNWDTGGTTYSPMQLSSPKGKISATDLRDPIFGALKVLAGDVIAIAGFASNQVQFGSQLVASAASTAKRYSGYSVELSVI